MSQVKKNGQPLPDTNEFQFPAKRDSQTFLQIFYNRKEGTYFGRTPKNWGQLLIFYTIFYIVLAAMFAICMQGLFASLSDKEPTWKLEESLIGTNPGLGFRPLSEETERGSVIQFNKQKPEEADYWVGLINKFLQPYKNETMSVGKQKYCSFNQTRQNHDACIVDMKSFGPCTAENGYGYKSGKPCVFLKLNKIFSWVPQYYNNPNDLPDNMPPSLKQRIGNATQSERNQVWVTCDGQHASDKEIIGQINYYPQQGFPGYYYPYINQDAYLSPLIAIQFENLTPNAMVNVECRAWAKNILYSGSMRDRQGSVTFQVIVD